MHIKLIFKGKITVKSGNPPPEPIKELKPYQNPFDLAILYKKTMKEQNLNQSQLAGQLGISRVRITQYLNLLKLDPLIIEQVMQNNRQVTERQLRILAGTKVYRKIY